MFLVSFGVKIWSFSEVFCKKLIVINSLKLFLNFLPPFGLCFAFCRITYPLSSITSAQTLWSTAPRWIWAFGTLQVISEIFAWNELHTSSTFHLRLLLVMLIMWTPLYLQDRKITTDWGPWATVEPMCLCSPSRSSAELATRMLWRRCISLQFSLIC